MGIIYKATNIYNDKVYIGRTTVSLQERIMRHIDEANEAFDKHKHYNENRFPFVLKDNPSIFEFEIIDTCEIEDELNDREKYWINFYNSTNHNSGYNIQKGGHHGVFSYKYYNKTLNEDSYLYKETLDMGKNICKNCEKIYSNSFLLPDHFDKDCAFCSLKERNIDYSLMIGTPETLKEDVRRAWSNPNNFNKKPKGFKENDYNL